MQKENLRLALIGFSSFLILFHFLLYASVRKKVVAGYGDFANFYAAATIVKAGEARTLYDTRVQARVQATLYPEARILPGPVLYLHPPFEVVLFLPLAYLPYPVAYAVWVSFILLLLLLITRIMEPGLSELKTPYGPLPGLMFLAFFPTFIAVLQGQDSILLLFLFAVAFLFLKRGKELGCGFLLGLGLFKFQLTLAFLAPFVIRRRWRVLLGFVAAAVPLVAVSAIVTGLGGLVSYVSLLLQLSRGLESPAVQDARGFHPDGMPNLRGTLYTLGQGVIPYTGITVVVGIISLGLLWWCARQWPPRLDQSSSVFDLSFSLNIVVALLVSFYLYLSDFTLLALPLALLANYLAPPRRSARALRLALLWLVPVFYLTPAYLLLMMGRRSGLHWFAWPLLLLALGISRELSRARRNLGSSPAGRAGVPSSR